MKAAMETSKAMRMPSETGDWGTSTRFSLTWSDGSAVLNHWTEACCEACAVGFHTAPSWKPADHMIAIEESACSSEPSRPTARPRKSRLVRVRGSVRGRVSVSVRVRVRVRVSGGVSVRVSYI